MQGRPPGVLQPLRTRRQDSHGMGRRHDQNGSLRLAGNDHSDQELYGNMSRALNATGRPVLFSLCNWGEAKVWEAAGHRPNVSHPNGPSTLLALFRCQQERRRRARPGHLRYHRVDGRACSKQVDQAVWMDGPRFSHDAVPDNGLHFESHRVHFLGAVVGASARID